MILLDLREGEPDRSGSAATFEGYFDFETGEPRRIGTGLPRLRIQADNRRGRALPDRAAGPPGAGADVVEPGPGFERVWGFEVWWRPDPQRTGVTDTDREELEESKRLLRGLVRDAARRPLMSARR